MSAKSGPFDRVRRAVNAVQAEAGASPSFVQRTLAASAQKPFLARHVRAMKKLSY